ncbi:MAG: DUF4301 family protein [Myxococcota bacterium]
MSNVAVGEPSTPQHPSATDPAPSVDHADQLARLRVPRAAVRVLRPCLLHDGIDALAPELDRELTVAWHEAATADRITTFVPASGAATRLWSEPLESLPDELATRLGAARDAGLPKGLVPFHRYADGTVRTAVEEQVRAATQVAGARARVHFTVPVDHRAAFEAELARIADQVAPTVTLTTSVQDPATDTVAIHLDGRQVLLDDGTPLLRPGGHGALLSELDALGADLVVIRNVDNICVHRLRGHLADWRRRLVGALVAVEQRVHDALRALDAGEADPEVLRELLLRLGITAPEGVDLPRFAWEQLHRPLRVCGMVPDVGHSGGGPFWAADADGIERRQIVEAAEFDTDDPEQQELMRSATHFNPVEIAASLRDHRGEPYDLSAYVDDRAWIVTEKSWNGERIRVLERPGLWNGGMGRWNTLFVELPISVFHPVKTARDLLEPGHDGLLTDDPTEF